jgi:cysteinyl-tRNA synthetase
MAANEKTPVKYWLHNNMITLNGQKMGKSLGNAVSLDDFFSGNNELLKQAYSPITIRFFMLQAHYRSPLDFSNEALLAAEKGLKKLFAAMQTLEKLKSSNSSTSDIHSLKEKCYASMNDDFNTPVLISHLFEGVRIINSVKDEKESITADDMAVLKETMNNFVFDVLGLKEEDTEGDNELVDALMNTMLDIRQKARETKDWSTSDLIRDNLAKLNIKIKDTKEGAEWAIDD